MSRTKSLKVSSQLTIEVLFCIISTSEFSLTHGIGGKRCLKLVLLSIMSLNKHIQTNVLLSHAVKSDETAVRKHPYPSGVGSNWRTTLLPLVLFHRYCSIATTLFNIVPARQYSVCNYDTNCCYPLTLLDMLKHSMHTCIYSFVCLYAFVCADMFPSAELVLS